MIKFRIAYLVIILSAVFALGTVSCGRNSTDDFNNYMDDDDDDGDDDDDDNHPPQVFSVDIPIKTYPAGDEYEIKVSYGDPDRDIIEMCYQTDYCVHDGTDMVHCFTGFCDQTANDVISCTVDNGYVCEDHTPKEYDSENKAAYSRKVKAGYPGGEEIRYIEQTWKYKFKDSKGNESNEESATVRIVYP